MTRQKEMGYATRYDELCVQGARGDSMRVAPDIHCLNEPREDTRVNMLIFRSTAVMVLLETDAMQRNSSKEINLSSNTNSKCMSTAIPH